MRGEEREERTNEVMPDIQSGEQLLGLIIIAAPVLLVMILGLTNLFESRLTEAGTARLVKVVNVIGSIAALLLLGTMLVFGERHVPVDLGNWVDIPHFHFRLKFIFDRLSIPFVVLTFTLCGTIGAFGERYMHREAGYHRFFMMYSIFVMGMVLTAAAGTIETLFTGWEFVGLSSAFLVAFFQERPAPVRNGLHVWTVYRISDAALLIAAVALHHLTGEGDFDQLLSVDSWPEGHVAASVTSSQAFLVGLLFLIAAAGKSALIPFSGWLPRAMEGPTPSSAVFYGALSVHLGAFLLFRFSPLIEKSWLLQTAVILAGLSTAFFAALADRVQTDIKCSLVYASLTQVGLIIAEIGLGWDYIPLVHLIGHACLRTLQFLRAPSLLLDRAVLENAVGRQLSRAEDQWILGLPPHWQRRLYWYGMERGAWDAWLQRLVVVPFTRVFQLCDRWERRWTDFVNGVAHRAEPPQSDHAESLGELP